EIDRVAPSVLLVAQGIAVRGLRLHVVDGGDGRGGSAEGGVAGDVVDPLAADIDDAAVAQRLQMLLACSQHRPAPGLFAPPVILPRQAIVDSTPCGRVGSRLDHEAASAMAEPARPRGHPGCFHGAKAFAVRCSTGVSSGKCRSSTLVMLLFSIQSMPG